MPFDLTSWKIGYQPPNITTQGPTGIPSSILEKFPELSLLSMMSSPDVVNPEVEAGLAKLKTRKKKQKGFVGSILTNPLGLSTPSDTVGIRTLLTGGI